MRRHLWLVAGAALLLLTARLLPLPQNGNLAGLPTICPFRTVTATPCPGCGLTRSVIFAAQGEWSHAHAFHPLGTVIFAGMWLALALGLVWTYRPFTLPASTLAWAGGTFAVTLLIVWILRLSGILPFPANF